MTFPRIYLCGKQFAVLFSILFFVDFIFAQQANDSTGCVPFVANFTGLNGATAINWDFGDGVGSNINNPQHTYSTIGTYTVTYTAIENSSPYIGKIIIRVFGKPVPKFSTADNLKGCVPLTITFTDQSTGGGGSAIVKWKWTFGDGGGNTSNTPTPTYIYNLAGVFDVSLLVTDANGCDSSVVVKKQVSASAPPNLTLTTSPSPSVSCTFPLTVTFNATATSNVASDPALTYSWSFGNGQSGTSITPSPAITYTAAGTYSVTLKATDANGCPTTRNQVVSIGKPISSFAVKDTVCKAVSFTNNSTPGSTGIWDYGDGTTGPSNPGSNNTHTYAASGFYSVKLTVNAAGCSDDTLRKIFVEVPKANFSSSPVYGCSLPMNLNLLNTSAPSGGSAYFWTFFTSNPTQNRLVPDTSSLQNPVVIVSKRDTNPFSVYKPEYIYAKLMIISKYGCVDTLTKLIDTVSLPTARFMPDTTYGCAPLKVQFSDSSLSNEPILSWLYDFGDGQTSTQQNPDHVFNNPGTYYVRLIIKNSKGCIDTSYSVKIVAGKKPNPDFSVSPTSICPGDSVKFTDLTPLSDSVDTWHYYADGKGMASSHCPGMPNPSWKFINATGTQDVKLEVGSKGCYSSITKAGVVTVKGPIANFISHMDCDSSLVYTFKGSMQDATSWQWDFGDGTVLANSTQSLVSHRYTASGDYSVILKSENSASGCTPWYDTLIAEVRQLKASFLSDTIFCTKTAVVFNASTSKDVHAVCNSGYNWFFDNNPPDISSQSTTTTSFSNPGPHDVKLIVKDINGCWDTIKRKVKASDVTASFTSDVKYVCVPVTANFDAGATISDTTVVSYHWNFGDGSTGTGKNVSHTFTNKTQAQFTVNLTATNILGCSSITKYVIIPSKPDSNFTGGPKLNICAGDPVNFTPSFLNHKTYQWNFGDGTPVSSLKSPAHIFTKAGSYTVNLSVSDSINCIASKTRFAYVNVQDYPQAGFVTSLDTARDKCYPKVVNFIDTNSLGVILGSRKWDLGTGSSTINAASVFNTYQNPGTYSAKLILTTTFGCQDTATRTIKLVGPKANFTLSPSTICKGDSVTLSLIPQDTLNVFTWHWDFGDGDGANAFNPIKHSFNYHPPGGKGIVTLIYWSEDSTCAKTTTLPITIHQVIAEFNRNKELAPNVSLSDTAHCLNLSDTFINTSVSANSFTWNFGDTQTSVLQNPQHTYSAPGTYTVSLSIKNNQTGCLDTMKKQMIIFSLPQALASGGDTCLGSSVQIKATPTLGLSYSWTPSSTLNANNIPNPVATPIVSTTYSLTVTNPDGCIDDTSVFVYIQQRPPSVIWDTTIVIGEKTPLIMNAGMGFIYSWSPSSDLNCTGCPNPVSSTLKDLKYTLEVSDTLGCFTAESYYTIKILPLSSVDVPTAFTPNGDGVNDIVFVDGWGIKKLLSFKIFNRWGELVFESTDIDVGWDGTFKSVPQNTETYVYYVVAETYIDKEPITKKGYVKILR